MTALQLTPADPVTAKAPIGFALCADDYGLSPAVGAAIRHLITASRLSAVSCMMTTEYWPDEGSKLRSMADSVDVGLHVCLTEGGPMGPMPVLAAQGTFPKPTSLVIRSLFDRIDRAEIAAEIDRQIDRFIAVMKRPPDFLDGHLHVHQLPVIRAAVFDALCRRFPHGKPWLRNSCQSLGEMLWHPKVVAKALTITLLGLGFGRLAARHGIASNRHFRGIRPFSPRPSFAQLFPCFLDRIAHGTLVMCHPGLDDGEYGDPRHPPRLRAEEFAYLSSSAFTTLMQTRNVALVRFSDVAAKEFQHRRATADRALPAVSPGAVYK
ncbi:MAG: ChbG/HpnK family deacetylase [Rhodospirillales bacterium]|nr:ChbG/HpnK family deacetylase [Rhodospirillales bacterium]